MAADHPLIIASTAEDGSVTDTLLDVFLKRMPLTIDTTEDLVDIVQSIGSTPLAILSATTGTVFFYDSSDTTTPDDGVTCLVDGNGHRYKVSESAAIEVSSVLSVEDTPPGSPTIGDAYIVDVAPSGAWAANAKDIAVYTTRGWVFAVPEVGATVLNEDTGINLQFSAAELWVEFGGAPADDSILPVHLAFPAGVSIEAQQNAPPSVPADPGILYLVGTAGSGDWSGHDNAFAFSRDAATWEFRAAYEGATVWNKTTDLALRYNGTAWVTIAGGIFDYQAFTVAGAVTWTKPANLPANAMVLVQAWGGGGGGSHGASNNGAGGGGGAYKQVWIRAADLGGTVSCNVGAGGAAGTSSGAAGGDGGNSTFGSYLTAYGGGGGGSGASPNGGGGGGLSSAGATTTPGGPTGLTPNVFGGAAGSAFTGGGAANGSSAIEDAGGGGGGGASNASAQSGGSANRGGGGGGNGNSPAAGGTSVLGGNGGGFNTAGSVRGGGGGGRNAGAGTAGAGGRGEIRVTVFA